MSTVKPLFFDTAAEGNRQVATTDDIEIAKIKLNGIGGVAIDSGGNRHTNVADPTAPTDAANLRTVQNAIVGVTNNHEAFVLADTNQTLSGPATIDGQTVPNGEQVLLTGQTDAKENGLWVVNTSGAWTRNSGPGEYATGAHAAGTYVFIKRGTKYAYRGYIASVDPAHDIIDTDPVTYTQFSGFGLDSTGNGLLINDNTLSLVFDPAGAIEATGSGVRSKVDGSTINIASDALAVLGVPSLFTIAGAAVSANVNAANLSTLVGNGYADSQHKHHFADTAESTEELFPAGTPAITPGYPVALSSTGYVAADASNDDKSLVVGICNAQGTGFKYIGSVRGILTGATKGTKYYLASGGGYTTTRPNNPGDVVVYLGKASNATDLAATVTRLYKV